MKRHDRQVHEYIDSKIVDNEIDTCVISRKHIDRQTDRQSDRQTGRKIDTDRQMDRIEWLSSIDRQTDRLMDGSIDRQKSRHKNSMHRRIDK